MSATTAAQAAVLKGRALRPPLFSNFPGIALPSCVRFSTSLRQPVKMSKFWGFAEALSLHAHTSRHRSHAFAGQLARLLHPGDELRFVEIALVDVEVAHFLVLGLTGRKRTQ
jgi:hypothetical protein